MATSQLYRLTVAVGGTNLGVFDGMSSGGGVTASPSKYRPGNLAKEVIETAPPSFDDITVTIGNEKSAYWTGTLKWLFSVAGTASMSVDRQPIDAQGNTVGDSTTYTGVLNAAAPGAVDSTDSSTEMITLTMTVGDAA
jgi:hypothetical protein